MTDQHQEMINTLTGADAEPIATAVPMAVGQKYRRRDGTIITITKQIGSNHSDTAAMKLFECELCWCYQCKTVNPETGWNVYGFEENAEDLIELLPDE